MKTDRPLAPITLRPDRFVQLIVKEDALAAYLRLTGEDDPDELPRTRTKRLRAAKAIQVLASAAEAGFAYLISSDRLRITILAELGRIDEDQRLLKAARFICENQLNNRRASAYLYCFRTGQVREPRKDGLIKAITTAITNYAAVYPTIDGRQIDEALEIVWELNVHIWAGAHVAAA